MNSGRSDLRLVVLCLIPVLVGLILWVSYTHGGSLPIPLPGSLPSGNASPPSLPSDRDLPVAVQNFISWTRGHAVLVITGLIVGAVAVIVLSGIWAETVQGRRRVDDLSDGQNQDDR